jgi:hypothetical protein
MHAAPWALQPLHSFLLPRLHDCLRTDVTDNHRGGGSAEDSLGRARGGRRGQPRLPPPVTRGHLSRREWAQVGD